jgi:4-diphosphocytidyl-2-C-methyl-D-erythritol kinase
MKIYSPAKINLFLKITGKRPDGYHDLITLMSCIDLYDTISITFNTKKISVICNNPKVPEDKTNLAHSAAILFLKSLNKQECVEICINKNIPVGAGLGGGSSNAASVLLCLNHYYGSPFSQEELMSMGQSIGADVPFFIFKKPAIASGIGENLEAYEGLTPYKILLIYPGFSVSTTKVYNNFNLGLTKIKKKHNFHLSKNQEFNIEYHLYNDLEKVTASWYPDIIAVKEALLRHGARGALMTGSGPTIFGLFSNTEKAQSANYSLSKNKKWQLFLADMLI